MTQHPWRTSITLALLVVAFPVAVAGVVAAFTPFGRNVEDKFFEVAALILPVVALPAFLERAGILTRRIADEGGTAKLTAFTAGHVIIVAGSLLVGESAALYAVATNTSSTFLVMTCVLSALFQVAWLSFNTARRIQAEGRDRHTP